MTRSRLAVSALFLLTAAGVAAVAALPAHEVAHKATPAAPLAAAATNPLAKLVEDKSAAVVTVKFVLKVEFPGRGEREFEREAFGVVMDPAGTVLISNLLMGGSNRGEMTITATQIKVLVGDDTEGLPAKLVTRDSELDLAWIKLDAPPEKPLVAVDFAKGVEPTIGDPILVLDRLEKFFDRVPVVNETKVGAIAKKPRPLYWPADEGKRIGTPIFTLDGKVVGFSVYQNTSSDDEDDMGGRPAVIILPAAEVVTATERAFKAAAEGKGDAPPAADKPEGMEPK
jgi:hypothetical protein